MNIVSNKSTDYKKNIINSHFIMWNTQKQSCWQAAVDMDADQATTADLKVVERSRGQLGERWREGSQIFRVEG